MCHHINNCCVELFYYSIVLTFVTVERVALMKSFGLCEDGGQRVRMVG